MFSRNRGARPRVAFFDFTGCEGCQLTVIDSLQRFPELLEAVEIVEFREAMSERSDTYAIAFVEGSCSRESDEARLRRIREQAAIVVALGACAHLGGINAIRNRQESADLRRYVYGDRADWYETYPPRPIEAVIPVDVVIPGCPIDSDEFVRVVKLLLQGRTPHLPDYPVCIECKLHETICLFERDQVCLGPITRAGCGAICPAFGYGCEGCRGLTPNPGLDVFREVLMAHGLTAAEADDRLTIFLTNQVIPVPWSARPPADALAPAATGG